MSESDVTRVRHVPVVAHRWRLELAMSCAGSAVRCSMLGHSMIRLPPTLLGGAWEIQAVWLTIVPLAELVLPYLASGQPTLLQAPTSRMFSLSILGITNSFLAAFEPGN